MKNMKHAMPAILGVLCVTGISFLTQDFTTAAVISMAGELGKGVASNLISNFIPTSIKRIEKDPNKLNHSIKKLFIQSISEALSYLFVIYDQEQNLSKAEKTKVYKLIKSIQNGLEENLMSTSLINLEDDGIKEILYQKDSLNKEDITRHILARLEISGANNISDSFKECFNKNYIDCVNLAFGENLKKKENADAWIAFQRMLLEEIREKLVKLENNQEQLIAMVAGIDQKISNVGYTSPYLSHSDLESIKELRDVLQNKEAVRVHVTKATNKKLNAIEQQTKQALSLIIRVNKTVEEIHIFLQDRWNERLRREKKITNVAITIAGIAAVAIVLLVYITYTQPFTLSVQTYGWKGKDHLPLKGVGTLQITFGDKTETAEINKLGEAIFKRIDHKFNHTAVPIRLSDTQGEPFYLSDSTLFINKDKMNQIQVSVKGIDLLKGTIIDHATGYELSGARVEIEGVSCLTNEIGCFEIRIPAEKQELEQEVKVYKDGYVTHKERFPMINDEECSIVLFRK